MNYSEMTIQQLQAERAKIDQELYYRIAGDPRVGLIIETSNDFTVSNPFRLDPKDDRVPCTHDAVKVDWNREAALNMTSAEVRAAYPRFDGICPTCKQRVVVYAAFEHYVAGDW